LQSSTLQFASLCTGVGRWCITMSRATITTLSLCCAYVYRLKLETSHHVIIPHQCGSSRKLWQNTTMKYILTRNSARQTSYKAALVSHIGRRLPTSEKQSPRLRRGFTPKDGIPSMSRLEYYKTWMLFIHY
jgi:hypothetical protein